MASFYDELVSGVHGNACAGCAHYLTPKKWSGPCAKGGILALRNRVPAHPDNAVVRAGNSCPDWAAAVALQVAA